VKLFKRWLAATANTNLTGWFEIQMIRAKSSSTSGARQRLWYDNALTRMKKLRPYLDNCFLEIDNNAAERSMRTMLLAGRTICSWVLNEVANQPLLLIR
jgi:hypothetical protein